MSNTRIRPDIRDFEPYVAGRSIDEIKAAYQLTSVIKLASNENPLGTSPVVQDVICKNASLAFRYAQAGNPVLRKALAEHLGIADTCIVCGNGSDEIIDLLIRVMARPGVDNVVAFDPCFSMYKVQSKLCGVAFRQAPLNRDFSFSWDGLLQIMDERTRIVFVTNPDNPSGYAAPASEILDLARRIPEQATLVVDEAYIDFSDPLETYSMLRLFENASNIVLLRTFSKLFGLAGLRLGYGIMPPDLADYLMRTRPPFSVNILAEKAGIAAINDTPFIEATRTTVLKGKEQLVRGMEACGCKVYPSQANFLLVKPPVDPARVCDALLRKGIIVRPLGSYGLDDCFRVSVGNAEENERFLHALGEVVHGS
ncbi:histidinol-phosphate transaminase [Desulfoplanes formicivorans]|uniref:Histidinol-phosphate aminotransferase n=1 Tax=Desulfoplanes formicivorans TaxID=1592317 RepID=A0A194AK39_9BACT|nr:histidinol-phosphate transaminase [Desulfoplanes formicivorans]GAU09678.1 histidinol-phosphate aminotransferase [Desulfoplanes formicivorans]